MPKNISLFLISFLFVLTITFPLLSYAGEAPDFFPANEDPNVSVNDLTLNRADVFSTVTRLINYALSFLGLISLILIIYAGATWMLAHGNEQEIEKAKETLKGAFIGLVIILSSYAISYFIFTQLAYIVTNQEAL